MTVQVALPGHVTYLNFGVPSVSLERLKLVVEICTQVTSTPSLQMTNTIKGTWSR